MLHKLLIALCSVFAFTLTACGGGDDDTDDQSVIVDNSGNEEIVGDPVVEPEPEPWLSHTFEDETDADTWGYVCANGCDATATIEHNADSETLEVTPEWASADDELEITTTIDPEIADLSGGHAHLYLWVPTAMAQAGDVNAQIVFSDASDLKGYIGYTTTEAGWNRFSLEELATDTDEEYGDFGFHEEGFNLQNVNSVGVQVLGAEGLIGVNETLRIDDVIVSPEPIEVAAKTEQPDPVNMDPLEAGDISFTFEADVEGWSADGSTGSEVSHDADTQSLVLEPDWENADEGGNRPKAMGITDESISEATIRYVVTLTQAQVDDGIQLQPYIQQNSGDYSQEFGGFVSDLSEGDNELTFEAAELADAQRFGIQVIGPADESAGDNILIKQVEIDLPADNTLEVGVSEGWSNDGSPATLSYNEGVVITPDWDGGDTQKAFGLLDEPVDLTGATVTYVVDVPQAYIDDGGMVVQPFSQQNSGDYTGIFDGSIDGGWNPASGLEAGENTIVHGPFDDPPADIERVGLQLLAEDKADGVTGDVTVKSVVVTFPEE